ncbi:MAG: glycosyltransferase family 2 protein [Clostridia bacterium]|nr:glycosyltransferase family 2 protein [Clostridia bacterium]
MTMEILLATYNGANYLPEQLDSILAQTDPDWHLTISDDGSTDDTARIIDEYVEKNPGKIERVILGKTFGNARDHFVEMIRRSDAPWCFLCDQDDTWIPEKIAKFREAIDQAETGFGADTPFLIFCDQIPTDAELKPVAESLMRYQKQYTEEFDYRSILMQNVVTGGAMAFNRALAEMALECKDFSKVIMHDWWMAAVAARFGQIIYLNEPLGTYRQHSENAVGAKAVGSVSYAKDRMSKLGEVCETIRKKKTQTALFRDTYRSRLTGKDLEFLDGFAKKRSGPGFYWKYGKLIHGVERKVGMTLLG